MDIPNYESLSRVTRVALSVAAATGGTGGGSGELENNNSTSYPQLNTPMKNESLSLNKNEIDKEGYTKNEKLDRGYSLNALWTMTIENDVEIDDELTKAQKRLAELKDSISVQSKHNFILEKDVRILDNRIALLIQNHRSLEDKGGHDDFRSLHLGINSKSEFPLMDSKRRQLYGHLFYILQSDPKYLVALMNHLKNEEMEGFIETVIFTIYGNQYDHREEMLLLKMIRFVLLSTWDENNPPKELGNILRANNPVSRIINAYTRRGSGQAYLKNIIYELVNGIFEKEEDLEINPEVLCKDPSFRNVTSGTIEDNSGSPNHSKQNIDETCLNAGTKEHLDAVIQERAAKIIKMTEECVNKIIDSINSIPYGIRWICKQIRSLAKRNCSDLTQDDLSTLVGGVFFLRFVNPAVTVPESSGLVNRVSKKCRRTLIIVSKIIQSTSNKPSRSRESYMSVFNPLIEKLKVPIKNFLGDICNVPDFYDNLEMEQYLALTRKKLKMNISAKDLYTIHSLLNKYIDKLSLSDDNRLRKCFSKLNPECLETLNKSDNKIFNLVLVRGSENLNNHESNNSFSLTEFTKRDLLYMDIKSTCIHIIRSIPSLSVSLNLDLSTSYNHKSNNQSKYDATIDPLKIADTAVSSKNSTLVKKGIQLRELIKQLKEIYPESRSNSYHQAMYEEIKNDLDNLDGLKSRVEKEIKGLEDVYKKLNEQNKYLMEQLESYEAYLVNVRSQSASGKVNNKNKHHNQGPLRLSYSYLEKDGTITSSSIPEMFRSNTFFHFYTPAPGSYTISIRYVGRQEDILHMNLSLDDILEKQEIGDKILDLECVKLDVTKVLQLINKYFLKR